MSVDGSSPGSASSADARPRAVSASYLPCRHCGEGSLVYDADLGTSVCQCCGARDD